MKARVAVIGGGQNCEHEVSLASAAAVALALEHVGYQVVRLTIGADGTWHDSGVRRPGLAGVVRILSGCDVVVPVVHGPHGEDGTLAALCDLAGITCVGSGLRAGALATAAVTMFDALGCAGVARIDFFLTAAGPVLNEVNTMPGFTEHSQVPKMFAVAGLPYPELLDLLVTDALAGQAPRESHRSYLPGQACCGGHDDGQPAAG